MEIITKFNFGQRVQAIVQGNEQYSEKCTLCEGTGKLRIKDITIDCVASECYGKGYINKSKPSAWYLPKYIESLGWSNFVVQKIGIVMHNPNNKKVSGNRSWIYYMADGSGTMWDEENLFASEDEAQKECDKRNAIDLK